MLTIDPLALCYFVFRTFNPELQRLNQSLVLLLLHFCACPPSKAESYLH
jgi:hypothetical protein